MSSSNPNGLVTPWEPVAAVDRIVGYQDIIDLLAPPHEYFKPHQAELKAFAGYKRTADSSECLFYPRIRAYGRNNPLRRKQLSGSHVARTVNQLRKIMVEGGLGPMRQTDIVFTMPRHISKRICQMKNPAAAAWGLWDKMWAVLQGATVYGAGTAAEVNLHLWHSECPVSPHVHFHVIVPDYRFLGNLDSGQGPWIRQRWHKQPYTAGELELIKTCWRRILVDFCRKHKLGTNFKKIDIYVDWCDWGAGEAGRAKFIHKIRYQRRHWTEDYARYTHDNPQAPMPPAWLEHYENKSRVYGWWARIKFFVGGGTMADKEKLSPIDGEPLIYVGERTLEQVLQHSGGQLCSLDICRGRCVSRELSAQDIAWLRAHSVPEPFSTPSLADPVPVASPGPPLVDPGLSEPLAPPPLPGGTLASGAVGTYR